MLTREEIKSLLRAEGLHPSPRMGQSFLLSIGALRSIAGALGGGAGGRAELVLEIGCGPGNLTEALLDEGFRVLAVERDRRLGRLCHRRLAGREGLTVVLADILRAPVRAPAAGRSVAVAGSLPYAITGEILRRITDEWPWVPVASILVQEEVAARLSAAPGNRHYGALTVLMALHWDIVRGIKIPAKSFFPRPAVDSRHVVLGRKDAGIEPGLAGFLRRVVIGVFSYRRKKLRGALGRALAGLGIDTELAGAAAEAGIDLDARPENLTPGQFLALARVLQPKA